MSMVIVETDLVVPVEPVNATVVGEKRMVVISPGTVGTVVGVHGGRLEPVTIDVEFRTEEGALAVARIPKEDVERHKREK